MIDTAPLYKPITHSYKGVYKGVGRDQWNAAVTTPEGKFKHIGRFSSQEEAARCVAGYYLNTLGVGWGELIQSRNRMKRDWRVKKITRFLYMTDLYRGPRTIVYSAELMVDETWKRIILSDIVKQGIEDTGSAQVVEGMWDAAAEGWKTSSAAVVAIRMFRSSQLV